MLATSPGPSASLFILGRFYTPFIDGSSHCPRAWDKKHADHIPFKVLGFCCSKNLRIGHRPKKMITTLVVYGWGGYLLGWIKLSPSHCGVVNLGRESGPNSYQTPQEVEPNLPAQLIIPEKCPTSHPQKQNLLGTSKPQQKKKLLIFCCNPLICRENAHPNICSLGLP